MYVCVGSPVEVRGSFEVVTGTEVLLRDAVRALAAIERRGDLLYRRESAGERVRRERKIRHERRGSQGRLFGEVEVFRLHELSAKTTYMLVPKAVWLQKLHLQGSPNSISTL